MREFIYNSVEFQNWGFNALTISFLATLFFTVIQGWGLRKQLQSILKAVNDDQPNDPIASISMIWHGYFALMFITFSIYGVYLQSLAIIFNGVLGIGHLSIVGSLWKFGNKKAIEKKLIICLVSMPLTMLIVPQKNWVYLVIAFGSLTAMAMQPLEILREGKPGAVDVWLIGTYLLATIFWIIYSFALNIWALKMITSGGLIILMLTLLLCYLYREPKPAKTIA